MSRQWTTRQLVENVSNFTGHDEEDVAEIVGALLKEVSSLVELGHDVRLDHLGIIQWQKTKATSSKNFQTGELKKHPAAWKPRMKLVRGLARMRK